MTQRAPDPERWAAALAARGERASPREDCPEPSEIWAASRGESGSVRARALLDHAVTCDACAEAWRLAQEIGSTLPASSVSTASAGARARQLRWAAAAVAAIALVSVLVPRLLRDDAPPILRQEGSFEIRSLVSEGEAFFRSAVVLRWTPGPEGTLYDLSVADERLDPLHVARGLTTAECAIPPSAVGRVPARGRILWRVEARAPDGSRASSPTFFALIE